MKIVDFHTHAFPDSLAPVAMGRLADGSHEYAPHHDGTIASLLRSMDESGIWSSVICSIATKPSQERPILEWSRQIVSDRIFPFISLHPEGTDHNALLDEARNAGIRGAKFHCMYQGFKADDEHALPIFEKLAARNMLALFHAGRDIRWPKSDVASPERLLNLHRRVPELCLVTAHTGGWLLWDEVEALLAGTQVIFDTSFTLGHITPEAWSRIWAKHSHDRIVFGSDSPWASQKAALDDLRQAIPDDLEFEKVVSLNARRILGA
ncbi:MAG TPA: amidohydrolase family protein [bacterium]|nr:amidohydrolase family protein [bacterium]